MNKVVIGIVVIISVLMVAMMIKNLSNRKNRHYIIHDVSVISDLFPRTVAQLDALKQSAMDQSKKTIDQIIAIPNQERTYANTAQALDRAVGLQFGVPSSIISSLSYVSPDTPIRDASNKAQVELRYFAIDTFGQNIALYEAFKAYVEGNAQKEQLTAKQRYFLDETMKDFKRGGLHLPKETRDKVKQIERELSELSTELRKILMKIKVRLSQHENSFLVSRMILSTL